MANCKKTYEWDYETWDDNNDIEDHNHRESLAEYHEDEITPHLVLVLNEEYSNGDLERYWAYVKDGKLPEKFADAGGVPRVLIPARFHKELEQYLRFK